MKVNPVPYRKNPYRLQVNMFAKGAGICTQCFSAPVAKDRLQCQKCIDRCFNKRKNKERSGGT